MGTVQIISLTMGLTGLVIGTVGAVLAILALIELKALKASTHNIQFVPIDEAAGPKTDEELSKQFKKSGIMAEPFDELPDEVIL